MPGGINHSQMGSNGFMALFYAQYSNSGKLGSQAVEIWTWGWLPFCQAARCADAPEFLPLTRCLAGLIIRKCLASLDSGGHVGLEWWRGKVGYIGCGLSWVCQIVSISSPSCLSGMVFSKWITGLISKCNWVPGFFCDRYFGVPRLWVSSVGTNVKGLPSGNLLHSYWKWP